MNQGVEAVTVDGPSVVDYDRIKKIFSQKIPNYFDFKHTFSQYRRIPPIRL